MEKIINFLVPGSKKDDEVLHDNDQASHTNTSHTTTTADTPEHHAVTGEGSHLNDTSAHHATDLSSKVGGSSDLRGTGGSSDLRVTGGSIRDPDISTGSSAVTDDASSTTAIKGGILGKTIQPAPSTGAGGIGSTTSTSGAGSIGSTGAGLTDARATGTTGTKATGMTGTGSTGTGSTSTGLTDAGATGTTGAKTTGTTGIGGIGSSGTGLTSSSPTGAGLTNTGATSTTGNKATGTGSTGTGAIGSTGTGSTGTGLTDAGATGTTGTKATGMTGTGSAGTRGIGSTGTGSTGTDALTAAKLAYREGHEHQSTGSAVTTGGNDVGRSFPLAGSNTTSGNSVNHPVTGLMSSGSHAGSSAQPGKASRDTEHITGANATRIIEDSTAPHDRCEDIVHGGPHVTRIAKKIDPCYDENESITGRAAGMLNDEAGAGRLGTATGSSSAAADSGIPHVVAGSLSHHEREAVLAGGVGAAGLGAYEAEKHHGSTAVPSSSGSSHHVGRDAALAGGAGATGLTAHEVDTHRGAMGSSSAATGSTNVDSLGSSASAHNSALLNKLDPHVKHTTTGQGATNVGDSGVSGSTLTGTKTNPYSSPGVDSHVNSITSGKDHHHGRDAAIGTAVLGAGHEADRHVHDKATATGTSGKDHHHVRDAAVGAGVLGAGYEADRHLHDRGTTHHDRDTMTGTSGQEHHYGRDAALGAGVAGAGYEANKHLHDRDANTGATGTTTGGSHNPLAPLTNTAAARAANQQAGSSTHTHDQHHYGRDAAIGAGVVGSGATAGHEFSKRDAEKEHKAERKHEKELEKEEEKEHKPSLINRLLHHGDSGSHHGKEAAAVGGTAVGAGVLEHERDMHERNKLHKDPPLSTYAAAPTSGYGTTAPAGHSGTTLGSTSQDRSSSIVIDPTTHLPMDLSKGRHIGAGTDDLPHPGHSNTLKDTPDINKHDPLHDPVGMGYGDNRPNPGL